MYREAHTHLRVALALLVIKYKAPTESIKDAVSRLYGAILDNETQLCECMGQQAAGVAVSLLPKKPCTLLRLENIEDFSDVYFVYFSEQLIVYPRSDEVLHFLKSCYGARCVYLVELLETLW